MSTFLPGIEMPLPEGERLLWKGGPSWRALAIHAFHTPKIAVYFALLIGVAAVSVRGEPEAGQRFLVSATWLALGGSAAIAFACVMAMLVARTTLYAITDRRVVMKIGVALPVVLNVPLGVIDGMAMQRRRDGGGNIALCLEKNVRVAYAILWPHARAWRVRHPEPLLRSIGDVQTVASVLNGALLSSMHPVEEAAAAPSGHAA